MKTCDLLSNALQDVENVCVHILRLVLLILVESKHLLERISDVEFDFNLDIFGLDAFEK